MRRCISHIPLLPLTHLFFGHLKGRFMCLSVFECECLYECVWVYLSVVCV